MANDLLGPPVDHAARVTLPLGGHASGTGELAVMQQMVGTLVGIEHAFQTQIRRQEEEKDTTKIVGYKSEVKETAFGARNLGQRPVRLGQGVEGKELWRRLTDLAMFGGRQRVEEGKRYKLTKLLRTATVNVTFGATEPQAPEEGYAMACDFQKVPTERIYLDSSLRGSSLRG